MYKIGFIGIGNMGGAILNGLLQSHFVDAEEVMVYDLDKSKMTDAQNKGIILGECEKDVVESCDHIVIGVKPQVVEEVLMPLKGVLKNKCLISIVLGYDFKMYNTILDASTRHIFVMPNTPVEVLQGMCLIEKENNLLPEEFEYVKNMFESLGSIEIMTSHDMAIGGALSGCGPAFMYMVMEALADGAVLKGLPREQAYRLASQLLIGSGTMLKETKKHPGHLKDQVCSPGGTTIQGVKTLEDHQVRSAFIEAICNSTKL